MEGCMTERKGCEEGLVRGEGGGVKKGGSVKKRESVIRVESEEKVGNGYRDGGVVKRRGGTAYKQLCYKPHTVLTYSHFIQFLYTAAE
jgi:hypothetical protein